MLNHRLGPRRPLHDPLDYDDRTRMEAERAIVAPSRQLRAERFHRLPLARRERWILEPVDDGQLQIGHATARLQREKRPIAGEGNDADAGQALEDRAVHHDEGSAIGNRHELRVRLLLYRDRGRPLLEELDDGPGEIRMHAPEAAYDLLGQGQGDDLPRPPELRRPAALGVKDWAHESLG